MTPTGKIWMTLDRQQISAAYPSTNGTSFSVEGNSLHDAPNPSKNGQKNMCYSAPLVYRPEKEKCA